MLDQTSQAQDGFIQECGYHQLLHASKKMMYKYILLLAPLVYSDLAAQENRVIDSISFYGILRQHIAIYDGKIELQDNSPRIGSKIFRKFQQEWYAKAQLEYGIHIVQGISFNKDANTAQQLISKPFVNAETFTPRLATLEIGHPIWGSISVGKQWGVYFDIGRYTDRFNLFGGAANATYSGGTDGGWSGTGRADKAIQYRNKFENWELGLQTQLNGKTTNFGVSTQYCFSKNLILGAAYNHAKISTKGQFLINDIGESTQNLILGLKYTKDNFYTAFTTSFNNGDIIVVNDSTILALDTYGHELLISYVFNPHWGIETGFNIAAAKQYNSYIKGTYQLQYYIVGLNYFFTPMTRLYATMRLNNSRNVNDLDGVSAYALGFRYDFDFNKITF